MSVEGKREGGGLKFRRQSVSELGIRLASPNVWLFRYVVQPIDMLTNLIKNGPRSVSIGRYVKSIFLRFDLPSTFRSTLKFTLVSG
jgi:hypothetical protein